MALNPTWNRFNVAPINGIIVIGHRRAMHSGLTRDNAINLIAWLTLATEASPEEIAHEIEHASDETPAAQSPALLRDRHKQPAPVKVVQGAQVYEVPAVRIVPEIAVVDESRARLKWIVPGTDDKAATNE